MTNTLPGGFCKFVQEGLNGQWLPSWFRQNGYSTSHVGKLVNNHTIANYDKPYPAGFNAMDCEYSGRKSWLSRANFAIVLVDPGTYIYYNATMQSNQDPPQNLPGKYSTDVVASRALDFMADAAKSQSPFFLTVAPVGPHGGTWFPRSFQNPGDFPVFNPPVPADRHKELYHGAIVPRGTNFNPDTIVSNMFEASSLGVRCLPCQIV